MGNQRSVCTYSTSATASSVRSGLIVVTVAGARVARLTRFETSVLADFGLPRILPW